MKDFAELSAAALRFAQQVAAIAFLEISVPPETARCLLLGEGERAEALCVFLERRCKSVTRAPKAGERYDLIAAFLETPPALLREHAQKDSLLLDIGGREGHVCHFDPALPVRQLRLLSLEKSNFASN